MPGFILRQAVLSDMQAVARLHRHVRKACLPYLPDLHTPAEDLAYFRQVAFPGSTIWLAEVNNHLIGFAAAKGEWLDHLYIEPAWHGRGVGSALLLTVQEGRSRLDLWTFQQNAAARRFYETRGFKAVETTDGSGNDERVPDIRYRWIRD